MTQPAAPTRPVRLATDLAKSLALSDAAKALLTPEHTPRQFFDALAAHAPLAEDAIRFLAVALPKREAVSWALACVRAVVAKPSPEEAKAITSAEAWVKNQSEANRRACGAAAEAAGHGTAAGCLADAAFWSGGSLSAPHLPPAPPRDDLTAIAATAAILLAAVIDPASAPARRSQFVALGAGVASGRR
jgi:hypothetical protein